MEALLWIKRNPMFANLNKRASLTSSTKSNDKKTSLFEELQGVKELGGVKIKACYIKKARQSVYKMEKES